MTGSSASASMAAGSTSADSGGGDVAFPSPSPTPAPAPSPSPAPSSQEASSASTYFRSPSAASDPSHRDDSDDRGHSNRGNRGGPSGGSDCKSASKGGGDDGSSFETPEEQLHRRRTTGSCSFYPNKFKECAEPRSCFDCLNFVVEGEEGGCMLSDWGKCVPARKYYNETMDFSRYKPSNANESTSVSSAASSRGSSSGSYADNSVKLPPPKDERYNFLADKAEYCAKNDPQCTACRRSVFADFIEGQTDRGRAAFCLGENGCVCIAVCEARMAHPQPPPKDCFAKALAAKEKGENKKGGGDSGWAAVSAVLGAMIFVMVTVFAIYRIRSKGERRSRTESIGNSSSSGGGGGGANGAGGVDPVNVVATPESNSSPSNTTMVTVTSTTAGSRLLNLFGWQAMRDDLINKEHMRFAGVEPTSPVKHSNVQFLGVEPSAPEIDSAVPTAPMAAMAIPVPMAMMAASAPMVFSVRAMASAPDFEDMDDEYEVL